MKLSEAEHLLETYELEEILNEQDLTLADALLYLIQTGFINKPNITPLDFDD